MEGIHKSYQVLTINQCYVFEQRTWKPSLNIYEMDDAVQVVVELAGIDPDLVTIEASASRVRIHGVRHLAKPPRLRRIDHMEIDAGPFEIEVPLSMPVNPEQAHSCYHQGLLKITLPLLPRSAQRLRTTMSEEEEQYG